MLDRFRPHFLKLGPRRFVVLTVITLLILDVINSYYFKLYWIKKNLSTFMVHTSIDRSQLALQDFSPDTVREMSSFIDNTFDFLLVLIVANNLFFYLFYLRKKLWAQGYVLFYTFTAALFSITFVFDQVGLGTLWLVFNIATVFVYAYLFVGVKVLKDETTLADGKTGR
ncbi:MAG TPA: hypothetical protein VNJ01_06810 [Bacteriovoracaceae bacterium]|nr:hypothetical protein [Bacteriovoracaceae bacterium]